MQLNAQALASMNKNALVIFMTKVRLLGYEVREIKALPDKSDSPKLYLLRQYHNYNNTRIHDDILIIPDYITKLPCDISKEVNNYLDKYDMLCVVGGKNLKECGAIFASLENEININLLDLSGLTSAPKLFLRANIEKFGKSAVPVIKRITNFDNINEVFLGSRVYECPLTSKYDLNNIVSMRKTFFACDILSNHIPFHGVVSRKFEFCNNTTKNLKDISSICSFMRCKDMIISINTDSLENAYAAFSDIEVDSLILDIGTLENVETQDLLYRAQISDFIAIYLPDDCNTEKVLKNFKCLDNLSCETKIVMNSKEIRLLNKRCKLTNKTLIEHTSELNKRSSERMISTLKYFLKEMKGITLDTSTIKLGG